MKYHFVKDNYFLNAFFVVILLLIVVAPVRSAAQTTGSCANILDFGGDNTNTSDNTAALTSAEASGTHIQTCVYFPRGTYRFASSQSLSIPAAYPTGSVTLKGDGSDVSLLNFASGTNGLAITLNSQYQSVHVQNLSILAGSASTSTIGIGIYQLQSSVSNPANTAMSDISYVSIRGNDGYGATNAFGYGINLYGVSNVNLISDNITGPLATNVTCIQDSGTSSIIPVVLNLTSVTANYCNIGMIYGDYLQGVTISQSNFTGDNIGVLAPSTAHALAQLTITGSQFNNYQADINLQTGPSGVQIVGNDFYISGTAAPAINIISGSDYVISGNVFLNNGSNNNGIVVQGYATGSGLIVDNVFNGLTTAIWLQSGAKYVTVGVNSFYNDTNTVLNSGTNNVVPLNCSGSPTPAFSTKNGIVTHC